MVSVARGFVMGCVNEALGVVGEDCASDVLGVVRGEGVRVPRMAEGAAQ